MNGIKLRTAVVAVDVSVLIATWFGGMHIIFGFFIAVLIDDVARLLEAIKISADSRLGK